MALLEIRTYPDPVLKKVAEPVVEFGPELARLVRDMAETMYASDGVGLAAPQVGVSRRLIILDVGSGEERGKQVLVLANPEIVSREGEVQWEEGCLSLPSVSLKMRRSARVVVRGQDLEGGEVEVEGDELLAVALQHEIDHLDGLVLFDRLSPVRRRLVLRDYRREIRESTEE